MSQAVTETPSMKRGVHLTPRLPTFVFDEASVPANWFAGDEGITAGWNALSVIASVGERMFIESGHWLIERIDDPVIADECARFVRQEGFHSAVHARFNRVLAERGLPVKEFALFVEEAIREIERNGGRETFLVATLAGEQAIGELGFAVLKRPESMSDVAAAPRSLWLWHWFEEVEHSAALHDAWTHVHGQSEAARQRRVLGAAYLAVVIAATWSAGSWAMLARESPERANRLSTWRGFAEQLAGKEGLLRDALGILWDIRRRDFHPFDRHEPKPLLDAHRMEFVRPEWERTTSTAPLKHGTTAPQPAREVEARDLASFVRYTGWLARRTIRFVRESS